MRLRPYGKGDRDAAVARMEALGSPFPSGRRREEQANQRVEELCGGEVSGKEPGVSPMQGQPELADAKTQPEGVRETRPFSSRAVSS